MSSSGATEARRFCKRFGDFAVDEDDNATDALVESSAVEVAPLPVAAAAETEATGGDAEEFAVVPAPDAFNCTGGGAVIT